MNRIKMKIPSYFWEYFLLATYITVSIYTVVLIVQMYD